MTTIVLPLDASSGTPTFNAQQTRQAFSAFLGPAPSGRPLGAISGVRPGTPSTTVSVTGTTWSCAAHSGVLDVEASAAAGPYLYATDGSDTGSITAADGTNPRVDIIYVQVSDNVQDSSGSEGGTVGYLAGTPAATPVAPNAPARSLVIANIAVPKLGGGNPAVSWMAPSYGVDLSTPWTAYTPTWTAVTTNPTIGNGTLSGAYLKVGKTVHYRITIKFGSTTNVGSGGYFFTLPVAPSAAYTYGGPMGMAGCYDVSTNSIFPRHAVFNTGSQVHLFDASNNRVNNATPVAWATNDTIQISGTYEAA
jgi:hypothetical protein